MNNRNKMRGMSLLLTLSSIVMIASSVQAEDNGSTEIAYKNLGAGIALGLAGIGTGLSQGPIGAAAVGMIAEDREGKGSQGMQLEKGCHHIRRHHQSWSFHT